MQERTCITVVICTWNRSGLLTQTLDQFQELRVPQNVDWELLIVDNNSTDDTRQVAERYGEALPIRYLFEPRPGKSNALNRAVREAKGEYILWTDDDVLVNPDWMVEYVAAFRRWPEALFFGGSIGPWFEGDPPEWLRATLGEIGGAYAILQVPQDTDLIGLHPLPFGANMATHKSAHARIPFDPKLGPRPGMKRVGEETRFMRMLQADGAIGRWVPRAGVRHLIPRDRQSIGYLRAYHIGEGPNVFDTGGGHGRTFLGRPLWIWKQALVCECRFQLGRGRVAPQQWVNDLVKASLAWGALFGNRENPLIGKKRKTPSSLPTPEVDGGKGRSSG